MTWINRVEGSEKKVRVIEEFECVRPGAGPTSPAKKIKRSKKAVCFFADPLSLHDRNTFVCRTFSYLEKIFSFYSQLMTVIN